MVRNFNKYGRVKENVLPTNEPQRIELPLFFNTPCRNKEIRVKHLRGHSMTQEKSQDINTNDITMADDSGRKDKNIHIKNADTQVHLASLRRLRDYSVLAFACRRAGKTRDEGRAYYSMGVLCDNIGKFKEAIVHYKKFLQVCKSIGDVHGEALA